MKTKFTVANYLHKFTVIPWHHNPQETKTKTLKVYSNVPGSMGNSQEKMQPKAVKNDGESWFKGILFLETVSDDIGQNRFALIAAKGEKGPNDSQPFISFNEISFSWLFHYCIRENVSNRSFAIVRKKPYSLEVLAAVKVASCGFNLETVGLPRMITRDVKKYQDLDERIKSFD